MLALPVYAVAQSDAPFSITNGAVTGYYLVERANLARYDNGKYIGLTHRETRARLPAQKRGAEGTQFTGVFFVLEETLHDQAQAARGLDDMVDSSFLLAPTGKMCFLKDNGYPRLRDFPSFPDSEIVAGMKWQAEGSRAIEPKNDGKRSTLPILAEYEAVGREQWQGCPVYRFRAKYAIRLPRYARKGEIDPSLKAATGTHDVDILLDADTESLVLMIDRQDETFTWDDGSSVRFRGTTTWFLDAPAPVAHDAVLNSLRRLAGGDEPGTAPVPLSGTASTSQNSGNVPTTAAPGSIPAQPAQDTQLTLPEPTIATDDAACGNSGGEPAVSGTGAVGTDANPSAGKVAESGTYQVEETPLGIRLSVRNLRFRADSDELLDGEGKRLESIAAVLLQVPGGQFLVEGHTAATGNPAGEKALSLRRAKRIVDELAARGLKPAQFLYSGYGAERPIADNATEKGKAQNRRVEITILE